MMTKGDIFRVYSTTIIFSVHPPHTHIMDVFSGFIGHDNIHKVKNVFIAKDMTMLPCHVPYGGHLGCCHYS